MSFADWTLRKIVSLAKEGRAWNVRAEWEVDGRLRETTQSLEYFEKNYLQTLKSMCFRSAQPSATACRP